MLGAYLGAYPNVASPASFSSSSSTSSSSSIFLVAELRTEAERDDNEHDEDVNHPQIGNCS